MNNFRKKGKVSLWIGQARVSKEVDILKQLCGVDYYDLDGQEVIVDDRDLKKSPIENLLQAISYSRSFLSEALAAAKQRDISMGLYVVCQFDFAYDAKRASPPIASDPVFLGTFNWSDDEDDE